MVALSARYLLVAWLLASSDAFAQANDCSDPFWSQTLRCKNFPGQVPQPPVPPPTPGTIRAYTRVDLTLDNAIRCVDGTRPIIWVDKAVGAPSNRWLITFTGGDNCNARDLDDNGSFEDGQLCQNYYDSTNGQFMGTANEAATSNLSDSNGNGILSPDTDLNPVFARFNRVRVHKCSYDRYQGRATHPGVSALPAVGPGFTYDLFNHGQKIALEALDTLVGQGAGQAGLSYQTFINIGGVVTPVPDTLPSLADATQVVFAGHSASGHGLYQNADRFAAYLRAVPGFNGDVRAIHDAHFMHSPENEAAFDPAQNPDPMTVNTLFEQRYTGTSPTFGAYNAMPFYSAINAYFAESYRAWLETPLSSLGTIADSSCVDSHTAAGDTWKCLDRFHVRYHHQTTPALMREDFLDPNIEHTNFPVGHVVQWGPLDTYAHCPQIGFSPCPPILSNLQTVTRQFVQARHFLEGVHTRSELATGADSSGTPGSVYLWMPTCRTHEGIYSDDQFFGTGMAQAGTLIRYRRFIENFLLAPPTGAIVARVSQLDGAQSECGAAMGADGFE